MGLLEGKMAKLAYIPVTMFSLIVFVIVFMCTGANEVEAQAPGCLPDNEGTFCLYIFICYFGNQAQVYGIGNQYIEVSVCSA